MTAQELRRLFVDYFINRGHKEIASASLLPDNDPSVLFTTAGMHPLVPYLLGERHPMGKRLVSIQKCLRTDDIDEVGDETHHTFFEMLGNWSLGDYFKEESIDMTFRFLTDVLSIPAHRLAVTVFEGDGPIPIDDDAYRCWKKTGLADEQVFLYGIKENWWGPAGKTGPCGPDTEIFYDTGKPPCGTACGPACHCGKYVEIWNNVFMQYNKLLNGSLTDLGQKNVDTGMGLERIFAYISNKRDHYETSLFKPLIEKIEEMTGLVYSEETCRDFRIMADHGRAIAFVLGDQKRITPANNGQGYILRRLIRRVIRLAGKYGVTGNILLPLAETVISIYGAEYTELTFNHDFIMAQLEKEYVLFGKTLDSGMKMADKYLCALKSGEELNGEALFRLYDTFGFPPELTQELANERGITVDVKGFQECLSAHQEKSRNSAAGFFSSGLADHSEHTARLHTATHLLNGALRMILGPGVYQRGSNITAERLRFDFSFDRKLTEDELNSIGSIVNEAISKEIDITCEELTVEQAMASGAVGVFEKKYGEVVKVYTINGYSREICGGPHARNTRELQSFRIIKEESSSAGVRRIKAVIG